MSEPSRSTPPDRPRRRGPSAANDPVLAKRARVANLAKVGQRIGYALFGVAIVLFFVGLATSYSGAVVNGIITCIVVGSLVLAPAIVFSYGVKAADRADREDDW